MSAPYYITTPIYYVNDVPHIGHAYTTIAADVLARYHRLLGENVFFLTGLDEHGQKVQQAAVKAGVDPKRYCDQLAPEFQQLWEKLHISNNAFIRTTQRRHQELVQQFLQTLFDKDLIYKADYSGWYCTFDERFWTEKDVVDGLCPDCKRPVERLTESNYFFRMSRYQDRLIAHIEHAPGFVLPKTRRNEVLGFLQKPLEDLSISRPKSRLSWGIELPFDPNYVTYVWFDALVNYISALHYLTPEPSFEMYWPATVHLVGKDILTTHSVYWSTMLMALELPLPKTIYAHGWWTVDGEKMSKSRGNVVDPYAMEQEFGADAFRYFLLREVPFGNDGDFSRAALIGRVNTDLANDLGNLLNRTLTMIERYTDARIPSPSTDAAATRVSFNPGFGVTDPAGRIRLMTDAVHQCLAHFQFHRALESMWDLVQYGNQYIENTAPWKLAKDADARPALCQVLFNLTDILYCTAQYLYPFMPTTAQEMARQLGVPLDFSRPLLKSTTPLNQLDWGDRTISKGSPLFPRIDAQATPTGDAAPSQETKGPPRSRESGTGSRSGSPSGQQEGESAQITIEDFQKVQLKSAKVLSAERVPKSEKLIKLRVDLGTEQRQIVAGIGKKYDPQSLEGRTVVIVANLKPAKLMGVESQGMVLAAGDKEVAGLVTVQEDIEPGTKVK